MDSWSIQKIWNEKLSLERTEGKVRNYISASDIGKPFLDRYYKMKGVKPTNGYDERILRVFDAGNIFEWIVERVFRLAGILQDTQVKIGIPENDKHLYIAGYIDCIVGGLPEWSIARDKIKADQLPEWLEKRCLRLIDELEKDYPNGLEPIVAEIKSVNSMAFWAHKNQTPEGFFKGYDHHKLQLLTYLLGQPIKKGRLFYISKDDLTLQETGVFVTDELLKVWNDDIESMSKFYRTNTEPPREEDIVFNKSKDKYEKNWKVGRSSYLTKITGLSKEDWEIKTHEKVLAKNKEYRKEKKKEAK